MPKSRSPNREAAFLLWLNSRGERSLQDIADELGVSAQQVRSWKSLDKWKLRVNEFPAPDGKGVIRKRKSGGQIGNKGGAPKGNKNNFKHGAYEAVMSRLLTGEEKEVFDDPDTGAYIEIELRRTLAALNAKEIRLMKRIEQIKLLTRDDSPLESRQETELEQKTGVYEEQVKGDKSTRIKVAGTGFYDGKLENVTVISTASALDALARLEAELDKVHGRKIKVLAQLDALNVTRERLDLERKRIEGESEQSKLANAWIAALTGEEADDDGPGEDDQSLSDEAEDIPEEA